MIKLRVRSTSLRRFSRSLRQGEKRFVTLFLLATAAVIFLLDTLPPVEAQIGLPQRQESHQAKSPAQRKLARPSKR